MASNNQENKIHDHLNHRAISEPQHLFASELLDEPYSTALSHGAEAPLVQFDQGLEEDEDEAGAQLLRERKIKLIDRLGKWATIALPLSYLGILAALGFLAFLWSANEANSTWLAIIVNGWATRAVSLSSTWIRNAADIQAGFGVAMLAALSLESFHTRLADAAKLSSLRSGRGKPYDLFPEAGRSISWSSAGLLAPATLLVCTTFLLQFSSTVLLSDLHLGPLPSRAQSSSHLIDLFYNVTGDYQTAIENATVLGTNTNYAVKAPLFPRGSTWRRSPGAFPVFAEVSEPVSTEDRTSDTGKLLRAFLPFPDAQSRETISNYTGKAMVLDSRVSCQRPLLHHFDIISNDSDFVQLTGSVSPSTTMPKLLSPSQPVPFSCYYLRESVQYSLCQLQPADPNLEHGASNPPQTAPVGSQPYNVIGGNRAGGLVSEFQNISTPQNYTSDTGPMSYGVAFLLVHSPSGEVELNGSVRYGYYDSADNGTNTTTVHNEWVTFDLSDFVSPAEDEGFVGEESEGTLSLSLCHAAWDAVVLPVNIHSTKNRSEPTAQYNATAATYQFFAVRQQLHHSSDSLSTADRGILDLEARDSWFPLPEDKPPIAWQPFVQNLGDIAGPIQQAWIDSDESRQFARMSGNNTILLYPNQADSAIAYGAASDIHSVYTEQYTLAQSPSIPSGVYTPDPVHSALFLEILENDGSLASAISALITVLSSMAYYDQLPQFTTSANATQVFFTTVLYPQSYRGFTAFVVVLSLHLLAIGIVTTTFISRSRYTLLGNSWLLVTQIFSAETKVIFEGDGLEVAKDSEIENMLKMIGEEHGGPGTKPAANDHYGVGLSKQSGRVELIQKEEAAETFVKRRRRRRMEKLERD